MAILRGRDCPHFADVESKVQGPGDSVKVTGNWAQNYFANRRAYAFQVNDLKIETRIFNFLMSS